MAGEVCQHTVNTKEGRTLVCGQVHDPRRCSGHSTIREGGDKPFDGTTRPLIGIKPCGMWKLKGMDVCRMHGGHAGRGGKERTKAKARERVAEQKIRKTLGVLNVVPVDNALVEMQALAGEVIAWKAKIAEHVAELEKLRYATDGGEQIRGEILLFERALDRCASVLGTIARLNIDERLARIEERRIEIVADALSKVFAEMGLSRDQQQEARRGLVRHLRAVAS